MDQTDVLVRPLTRLSLAEQECLFPGQDLDGVIIRAFLQLAERRNARQRDLPKVWVMDTMGMTALMTKGIPGVVDRFRAVRLREWDMLVFPTHLQDVGARGHWAVIVVEVRWRVVIAYDPMHFSRMRELEEVRELLWVLEEVDEGDATNRPWHLVDGRADLPRQTDDSSCGVLVCAVASEMMARRPVAGRTMVANDWRKRMAAAFRRGQLEDDPGEPTWTELLAERERRYGRDTDQRASLTRLTLRGLTPTPIVIDVPEDPVSWNAGQASRKQLTFERPVDYIAIDLTDDASEGAGDEGCDGDDPTEEPPQSDWSDGEDTPIKRDATPDPEIEEDEKMMEETPIKDSVQEQADPQPEARAMGHTNPTSAPRAVDTKKGYWRKRGSKGQREKRVRHLRLGKGSVSAKRYYEPK